MVCSNSQNWEGILYSCLSLIYSDINQPALTFCRGTSWGMLRPWLMYDPGRRPGSKCSHLSHWLVCPTFVGVWRRLSSPCRKTVSRGKTLLRLDWRGRAAELVGRGAVRPAHFSAVRDSNRIDSCSGAVIFICSPNIKIGPCPI